MALPPPILVETADAWRACLSHLNQQQELAVDMESNGLHAYRERVCLIQVSSPGQDYLIDPLRLSNIDGFGELMADPAVAKIFHAAEYDLLSMKRDYCWSFANLFDTMLAARILGWRKIGLGNILKQEFDVIVDKRFQRANWGRRPLSPEQIAYARKDTHYLIPLRRKLEAKLEAAGRLAEATDSFQRLTEVVPVHRCFSADSFWGLLNGRSQLAPQQHAVLRELFVFREHEAQRRDRPPFKILGNRTLIELAEELPHHLDEIQGIYGMTPRVISRYGRQLIKIIRRGMRLPPPERPAHQPRPPEAVLARFDALMSWRKARADKRGVESDIIVSRKALWELAVRDPKDAAALEPIRLLGGWQRKTYGDEILQLLKQLRTER